MAPRRAAFRAGIFFLLRRGGVAEYDASWLFLGPSDVLVSAATGIASYCGGEFDALVASVELELESELEEEEEECWSSSLEELEDVAPFSVSLGEVMASETI